MIISYTYCNEYASPETADKAFMAEDWDEPGCPFSDKGASQRGAASETKKYFGACCSDSASRYRGGTVPRRLAVASRSPCPPTPRSHASPGKTSCDGAYSTVVLAATEAVVAAVVALASI